MTLAMFYLDWRSTFHRSGLSEEIAAREWHEWVASLDGELDNKHTQTALSVKLSADLAISELTA